MASRLRKFFSAVADQFKSRSAFEMHLGMVLGLNKDTKEKIENAFQNLGLPVPQGNGEFVSATEGCLLFLKEYGIVIRIEARDGKTRRPADRINDNPWILKPLATLEAGDAVIEICPGCHTLDQDADSSRKIMSSLSRSLDETGVDFLDLGIRNIGLLPYKTPVFPEGVPVIIDRLAVTRLSKDTKNIREAVFKMGLGSDPQDELYGPLKSAFAEAWPDPEKMREFWRLCADHRKSGKLVAGWETPERGGRKKEEAKRAAEGYERALSAHEVVPPNSSAAAVPRSPRPPV